MAQSVDEQFRRLFDSLLERIESEIRAHASEGAEQLRQTVEGLGAREAELVERTKNETFEATQLLLSRLVTAVRALDEASALSQTLETLVSAIRGEARHAGLFLWRNDQLRSWGSAAFTSSDGIPVIDLNPDNAGVIADAARTGSPRLATSSDRWPTFADPAPDG